jgi:uncharacterized iron-regulated protein
MKYAIFFSVFFVSSGFCSQYVAIKGTFSNLGGKATSTHYILKSAAGSVSNWTILECQLY